MEQSDPTGARARMPRWAVLAGAAGALGAAGAAQATPPSVGSERAELEARVAAARAQLQEAARAADGRPYVAFTLGGQIEAWNNWPNWSNWANWANG